MMVATTTTTTRRRRNPSERLVLMLVAVLLVVGQFFRIDIKTTLTTPPCEETVHVQPRENKPRRKTTAVVWTTLGITSDCEAARVRHLVETAPATMDVWLLHAHSVLQSQGRHEEVAISHRNIANIPNLHHTHQYQIPFLPFDELAGVSKSSFLRFLAGHPEYEYGWILENDLFYTGPWHEILQSENNSTANEEIDFLTTKIYQQKDTGWFWFTNCQIFGKDCTEVDPESLQVHWMLARVSNRLAKSLVRDLYEGRIQGFHEAILGAYLQHVRGTTGSLFSKGLINPNRIGQINVGHAGKQLEASSLTNEQLTVASRNPQPGKLLHPVKCDAYHTNNENNTIIVTMENEIEKWTKQ